MSRIPGQLSQVGAAGQAAGQKTAQGFKQAQQSAEGLGSSLLGLMKAQIGLAAIKGTAMAMADSFKETSQNLHQAALDFQNLRRSMQEVATLKGVPNTGKFTVAEARAAAAASMTPQERRDAQAAFLNFAGAQIGPGKKLTTPQAEDFSTRIGVMMKAAGYTPEAGMTLGGSILQQKMGPQNVDQLMREFSTAFQVMEKGQVPIGRAGPEVAELMASGVSAVDAAKLFSVVSPAAPGQEGTSTQAALRAIEDIRVAGTAAQFGIGPDMTPYESAKAFGTNLAGRRAALLQGGMSDEAAKIALAATLKQKGVAADIRERRGLLAGVGRMGTELGGFQTFEQIAAGVSPTFEAERRQTYEQSEEGRQAKVVAVHAAENAAMGARNDEIARRRMIARTELMAGGRLEQVPIWQRVASTLNPFGGLEEEQVNRQMLMRIQAERRLPPLLGGNAASLSSALTDEAMRGYLADTAANTARMVRPPALAVPAGLPANGHRPGN